MIAQKRYPEQAECIFVKRLIQNMHSECFLNFDRKIYYPAFFSTEISLIFLNYLPIS